MGREAHSGIGKGPQGRRVSRDEVEGRRADGRARRTGGEKTKSIRTVGGDSS